MCIAKLLPLVFRNTWVITVCENGLVKRRIISSDNYYEGQFDCPFSITSCVDGFIHV